MTNEGYFKGKKVLVAGATGFIGTNLCEKLVSLGAHVRGTIYNHQPKVLNDKIEYILSDLTKYEDCLRVTSDIDFVFMAAANSSGAGVMKNTPLVHLTPNVVMNTFMPAAALENSVSKFCFISSNTVYPQVDYPVKEEDAGFDFFDKYYVVGWMKRFSEIMCGMYSNKIDNPLDMLIVRPGNLYGPFDKFTLKESKVIAALIRRAIEKENPFTVWGDGTDMKDFLFIDDFIDGVIMAFTSEERLEIVNIASGNSVILKDVLELILQMSNHQINSVEFDLTKPVMIPNRYIDISKLSSATGWAPKTSLRNGLDATIKWYQEEYSSKNPEGEMYVNL
jgi:GDP-L-fucose synthase